MLKPVEGKMALTLHSSLRSTAAIALWDLHSVMVNPQKPQNSQLSTVLLKRWKAQMLVMDITNIEGNLCRGTE